MVQLNENYSRILLVEDEAALVFGLKKLLQSPNRFVDTAMTLNEALTLIETNRYRVVISDLRLAFMHVLEGLDVIKAVKERQPGCTIIAITAYGEDALDDKVRGLGADYYLEKPVPLKKIKDIFDTLGV